MSLILESKNKISELSEAYLNNLCYGYSCDPNANTKITKIKNYLRVLEEDDKAEKLGFKSCLSEKAKECLEEQLRSLIGFPKGDCSDVEVDNTNQEFWELKNPYCVSYECWNKWARITARDLELNISNPDHEDELILEIATEMISADVLLSLSVVMEANELDIEVSRTIEESKIDFELLLEQVDCDLDFKAYMKLIDNKFSYDIIKTIYDNNLSIDVSSTTGEDEIKIKTSLSEYNLKELDIDLKLIQDKFGYSSTINKPDLLTDYNC